jgi:hypothetical protein
MYEAVSMDMAECRRQADSDTQDAGQIERSSVALLKNQVQGLASGVLQYENRLRFVTSKRQRLGCPRGIEFGGK